MSSQTKSQEQYVKEIIGNLHSLVHKSEINLDKKWQDRKLTWPAQLACLCSTSAENSAWQKALSLCEERGYIRIIQRDKKSGWKKVFHKQDPMYNAAPKKMVILDAETEKILQEEDEFQSTLSECSKPSTSYGLICTILSVPTSTTTEKLAERLHHVRSEKISNPFLRNHFTEKILYF